MSKLTEILSPDLNPNDLIAVNPDWKRADFNRAADYLSGRLKAAGVRTAALWFDDAAWFACAVLAAWHAGVRVVLPSNLAAENIAWANGAADVWLADAASQTLAGVSDGLSVWAIDELIKTMPSEYQTDAQNWRLHENAEAWLKTSGSGGAAQVVVKTLAQMQAEAAALADFLPFADCGEVGRTVAVGSVSPQHLYGFTFRFAVSLVAGWPMAREQYVYPETLLAATAAHKNVVWMTSPALLNRMGEARNWAAVRPLLRGILSAGGALPEATAALLAHHAVMPSEIYGSTETGVIAQRSGSGLWRPFAAVEIGQNAEGALWAQSPWSGGRQQTADMIETQNGGFILLGRSDRIIKFEDKRVSLVQIEHDLLAHRWVADACCGLHPQYKRLAAWLALNAAGINALREQGRAAVVAALKKHLAQTQDPIAVPRYWRFAAELPRNAQAKIAAADFQTAFTQTQTAPEWPFEMVQTAANEWQIYSRVPLDLVYFGGHFATFPLVPGVVELQWVRDLAARFVWGRQSIVRVENLKYQQFLRPHDEIRVQLNYDADKNKLTFKLENGAAVCASGRLVFGRFERQEAV
ncbi:AMP-binding protein [Uruburuella testudinis]|uniref:AMP-binding protein n=1 Tax=Uruburuella testudinis TaxID=1282863 RepID=A0ABY4DRV7_9NEIS|nr:AMP-binding protein [Uruburuella testudinis]UOO80724.1 AMP-binding protein [Uruburuella testudinis]